MNRRIEDCLPQNWNEAAKRRIIRQRVLLPDGAEAGNRCAFTVLGLPRMTSVRLRACPPSSRWGILHEYRFLESRSSSPHGPRVLHEAFCKRNAKAPPLGQRNAGRGDAGGNLHSHGMNNL